MAKEEKIEAVETVEETVETAEETVEKPKQTKKNNPNELVNLTIPISQEMQDDWFCCVNGKTFQVQRGKEVKVPKWVKEVYDNEQRMETESIMRSRALQKKLADKERAFS